MANKNSKAPIIIIIIALLFLLFINLLLYRGKEGTGVEVRVHRSTYNPRPSGLKAYFLLLQKQGFKVQRWSHSLEELPAEARLLLLADPEQAVTQKELEALSLWISRGNTAAFFLDDRETLKSWDLIIRYQRLAEETITPSPSLPLTEGVKILKEKGGYRLETSRKDLLVLAEDQTGPLMVLVPKGKGRLLLVSSPWMLSNAGLGEGDNYLFCLNLARLYAGGAAVLFDEYHHGYGSDRSLSSYLAKRPLFWSLIQLLLWGLLFIYVRNVRLGRAKILHYEERRSALEYVASMANIYRLAKAEVLALETLYRSFLREVQRRLGPAPTLSHETIADYLNNLGAGEKDKIVQILSRIETLLSQGKGELKEVYALAANLEQWRKKIKGV